MLVVATVVALVWANSPWKESYFDLWHTHLSITLGSHSIDLDLQEWVNEALMAIFFFVVGLEIKRELVEGELRDPRKASLPAIAAVGGMLVPALIYVVINAGGDGIGGWGIPMATDIAMAIGVVSLLGARVDPSLKLFLLALAIVDDVGAIVVIAIFYSDHIDLAPLGVARRSRPRSRCPPGSRGPLRAPARRSRVLPVARAPRGRRSRDDRRGHPRADGPDDARAPTSPHRRGGVTRSLHRPGRRPHRDARARVRVDRGMARASVAPVDELRDRAALCAGERGHPVVVRSPLGRRVVAHHARRGARTRDRQDDRRRGVLLDRDPDADRHPPRGRRRGMGCSAWRCWPASGSPSRSSSPDSRSKRSSVSRTKPRSGSLPRRSSRRAAVPSCCCGASGEVLRALRARD